MSERMASGEAPGMAHLAGKYLTFGLGEEVFGLEILKVQEIIGLMNITRLPKTPEFVRGVINLRGKVIPVIALRAKFGMPTADDTERTCIIVIQVAGQDGPLVVGLLVDAVSEVVNVSADQLEPSPRFGTLDTAFMRAMGKINNRVVILLDVDRVLRASEWASVAQGAAE
jgi:purine-binding chemotaxis protein CheW